MVKSYIFSLKLVTILIPKYETKTAKSTNIIKKNLIKNVTFEFLTNKQNRYLTIPFRRTSWYELEDSSSGNSALQVNESGNSAVMVSL